MTRFIVLGLLVVVLWLALKNFTLQVKMAFGQNPGRREPPSPRAMAETLVRCARCGTYVVASRALKAKGDGEEAFCSEGCRGAGAA